MAARMAGNSGSVNVCTLFFHSNHASSERRLFIMDISVHPFIHFFVAHAPSRKKQTDAYGVLLSSHCVSVVIWILDAPDSEHPLFLSGLPVSKWPAAAQISSRKRQPRRRVEWLKRISRVGAWMPEGRTSALETCPITALMKRCGTWEEATTSLAARLGGARAKIEAARPNAVAFKSHQTRN